MTVHRANLKIVEPAYSPEQCLREAFTALATAERHVRDLQAIIAVEGRKIAGQRGLAFLRVEALKREFGPK
jgi:hypothetical protein